MSSMFFLVCFRGIALVFLLIAVAAFAGEVAILGTTMEAFAEMRTAGHHPSAADMVFTSVAHLPIILGFACTIGAIDIWRTTRATYE